MSTAATHLGVSIKPLMFVTNMVVASGPEEL